MEVPFLKKKKVLYTENLTYLLLDLFWQGSICSSSPERQQIEGLSPLL